MGSESSKKVKVAVSSVGAEQIGRKSIAEPNGWQFYNEFEFPKMWGTPMAPTNGTAPDVFIWKGFFVNDYYSLWKHLRTMGDVGQQYNPQCKRAERVIILWAGSDCQMLAEFYRQMGQYESRIFQELRSDRFVHVPVSERQKNDLKNMFDIEATEPLPTPARTVFQTLPMPKKPTVATYLPPHRMPLFRSGVLFGVAKLMPEVNFVFYHWLFRSPEMAGLPDKPNIFYRYALSREEYEQVVADSSCLLRIPASEGLSSGAAEFIMAGRPVLSCHDMPKYPAALNHHRLEPGIIKEKIEKLVLEVPDETAKWYRDYFDPKKFRERLNERIVTKWPGVVL